MKADECRGSEDVRLMSTCHAQGHHVRTILVAPLRTIAGYRITLDMGDGVRVNYCNFCASLDGVNMATGGLGDE